MDHLPGEANADQGATRGGAGVIASNPIVDIWTGDMGALMALWFLLIPFILLYAAFKWLKDKITTTNKKENSNDQTHRSGY